MTRDQDTKLAGHHSTVAIASIWVLFIALIVVFEVVSLLMTPYVGDASKAPPVHAGLSAKAKN